MATQGQAMLQAQLEAAVLQSVAAAEQQVDEQLKKLEVMDKDELEEMEAVRARRLAQMKAARAKRQMGHGEYREIGGNGNEQEFFEAAKASDRMVCHFYRDSTERCAIMDSHMSKLAQMHPETRFVKINAEKSPFLAERLRIIMLPTVALVVKGKIKDYIVGFDDLGGADDFDTEVLEWRIGAAGVLDYTGALEGPPSGKDKKKNTFIGKADAKGRRGGRYGWEDDSDDDFS
mmetsp:Transcript_6207/g.15995  ORF Transcript_6207/g.15995 Transcript_6207/m.15995 type:complete len:232 (+) Transcript_6207:61-756(+)|eukprot:CAMPEP_0182924302 /NCGR_PEP_ID=MMETSP0105_2-20130417/5959_1 /TAXON_ID=81532 ORGANISM="Acanthoeca-like sp., Strain 10tr" /NCGR_SAMPLE_ID=MMETSP0105_2 /ASSEMBLY_ACC=CAM_ASM_000205 /LENGTH=231 /DNA_ID=CAMNT_0025062067 /DNA_START=67 /DNA_END=762 /DNA_ORIENTATION=+